MGATVAYVAPVVTGASVVFPIDTGVVVKSMDTGANVVFPVDDTGGIVAGTVATGAVDAGTEADAGTAAVISLHTQAKCGAKLLVSQMK